MQQPPPPPPPAIAGATEAPPIPLVVPMSRQELEAFRARRGQLSSQLQSANSRREELAEQLKSADPAARAGLQERMGVLDRRIVQLESDIAENGRALSSLPAGMVATTEPGNISGELSNDQVTAISIVFIVVVMMPLAVSFARRMWKRGTAPVAKTSATDTVRLERMEQAMEAIAIEIERVSEGQRFLTRLLGDTKERPALGAGTGDRAPDAVHFQQKVGIPRDER